MKRQRILVAMSGGVDSAAAACFLAEEGHEVVGATLKLWCYGGTSASARSCCSLRDIEDARGVAAALGIRHYVLDEAEAFERQVVTPFVTSYVHGETPNPCVRCNTYLKFGSLLERARTLGFDAVATGHYARITAGADGPELRRAVDRAKDQAYVLWGLARDDLRFARFPLGERTKAQARDAARRAGLPVAEKLESQDVCFVQGGHYGDFVAARAEGAPPTAPGDVVDTAGRVLGRHRGAVHYTVGQRRGLGVANGKPLYVVRVEAAANRVVVGPEEDLQARAMEVREVNWVSCAPPNGSWAVQVKVRYRSEPAPAVITPGPEGRVGVRFEQPLRAVTPGQSAVFFQGDLVLGGGVIARAVPE